MRLAHYLGYPSPDHFLSQVSSRQLTEILAFYRVEPLPEKKMVELLALACVLLAGSRGSKISMDDLVPNYWEQALDAPAPDVAEKIKSVFSQLKSKREVSHRNRRQPKRSARSK